MIAVECHLAECTVAQTGICAQSVSDPTQCVNSLRFESSEVIRQQSKRAGTDVAPQLDARVSPALIGRPVLPSPSVETVSLYRTGTLGLASASSIMREKYVTVVGIVGLPDAGKTACLASMYLLLAHGSLGGFTYADSRTLLALEEISRGARRWNQGEPPGQMTLHTELVDERQAGFLHFQLVRDADKSKHDIFLPDLPGEWTRSLITDGDGSRFSFLRSSDVLWVMVDGRKFLSDTDRQLAEYSTTNLIERLATIFTGRKPKLILVASWLDKGQVPEAVVDRITRHAKRFGFRLVPSEIASFSDVDGVAPGAGIAELLEESLTTTVDPMNSWPAQKFVEADREFLRFPRGRYE